MHGSDRAERWSWLASQSEGLRGKLARRFGDEEAGDVSQEAILRAALWRGPLPPHASAWLVRIARNIGIDRWRRDRRIAPIDAGLHLTAELGPVAERVDIEAALERLPRSDRELLASLAAGSSYQDIAAAERLRPAAVRQRVARARARLLARIAEVEDGRKR